MSIIVASSLVFGLICPFWLDGVTIRSVCGLVFAKHGHARRSQQDYGEHVQSVYDECECAGICAAYTIDNKACYYNVMPRSRTVRSGNNHSKSYHAECQQSSVCPEVGGKRKGVEHQPEVEQVEKAYQHGIKREKPWMAAVCNRKKSLFEF